ncbi:MAG TPA: dTDP-4-dehydrorhamnose reductase [Vicinamibacterales bacterium]|jgi:dTDP-4-dehydrorhamnose reductase|nr:dTDP-4-dehydrorhamnose reductase [Vicinamibacterales bacterium]
MTPKVLVVGAAGQLGSAMVRRLSHDTTVVGLTRRELELTNHAAVATVVARERPAVILNCAAYNAVDQAEGAVADALAVNAFVPQSLARAARAVDATLVHYSTDFVFDGHASRPYTESDAPNPQSVYGQSKLIGEWLASDAPRAYVLRVESLFGGPAARSSIDRIIASLRSGEPARVFVDRVVTPSFVDDVVDATWSLLTREAEPGLYHVVNAGETTWHALGAEAARLLGTDANLVPVRVADVPMRAARPQYCALSTARLAGAGVSMPAWQDALGRYIRLLAN